MKEEKRIYVVIPAVVTASASFVHHKRPDGEMKTISNYVHSRPKYVIQPHGRQIAQACHVVSKLRWHENHPQFQPVTTIVLQARNTNELVHIFIALSKNKKLKLATFQDENKEAYGHTQPTTALAVLATPKQIEGILDYLPLWGS